MFLRLGTLFCFITLAWGGDADFLRRVTLDLTGRLPEPAVAKQFLADKDPNKRTKMIDSLFPPIPEVGMRAIKDAPFLDRWAYFFNDLFRNGQLLEEGINTFYDFTYKSLLLNVPYDEMVRDMITASAVSTWADGASNFLARSHVFEGDGYVMNHEDTADEIAINTSRIFLGVNLECVSCHDGKGHLEKINLWLAGRKRSDLWRQASFFGKTYIAPVYGRTPQFMVKDKRAGYDLTTVSSLRPPRKKGEDVTPTFILDGAKARAGERDREAYARMLTGHPQFARTTVNMIWAELMGQGIVEPIFDFDLARQDKKNPPPAPWTLQPSDPDLLDGLAAEFQAKGYDLRWLIRRIVTSPQYQSLQVSRRMSAEQMWDSISQITGQQQEVKVSFSDKKVKWVMQTRSPQDLEKSGMKKTHALLSAFGQCDRYNAQADRKPTMIQTALLLNDATVKEKLKVDATKKMSPEFVEDLFYRALSRPPTEAEMKVALGLEVEDLLWVMVNRLDFLFY